MKYNDIAGTVYDIDTKNYENIFSIYEDEDSYYYYNLLKKIDIPSDLSSEVYTNYEVKQKDSYQLISYKHYSTINLWWLICAANQIDNPTELPRVGMILKIIKPVFASQIVAKINSAE